MSNRSAIAVSVEGGSPGELPGRAIEVDAGVALPVASGGLRLAMRIGDPLRVAQSLAGQALAEGSRDWAEALRCAQASTTTPAETEPLVRALSSGDAEALRKAMPRPRSKLNRPFDAVNLY